MFLFSLAWRLPISEAGRDLDLRISFSLNTGGGSSALLSEIKCQA